MKATLAAGDQALASRISQFQFRDIRPKAASGIADVEQASLPLGHIEGDITERVYRHVGALAKPTKYGKYRKRFRNQPFPRACPQTVFLAQKRKKP